ncbi:MAG: cytochrome c biogenesis protein CcsA [Halobacteriota archaeon]
MNFGMVLIWIAFILGASSTVYSIIHLRTDSAHSGSLSRKLEIGCAAVITIAILMLTYYLITVSASYVYVYMHSSIDLEFVYRLSALWAGQEGSFLLWTWFTLLMLLAMQYTGHTKELFDTRVMNITRAICLCIVTVFLLLLVLKNPFSMYYGSLGTYVEISNWNPFLAAYPLLDGQGMNPLLRNPWMAVHPPVLFLGYAAFTIPFAAAFTNLLIDDEKWIKISRDWMRMAWLFLTAGIGLGGFWAYEVLGWGAWYWTWDPVETSSLIPWITATTYLHSQTRVRYGEYGFLAPMLAVTSFILVIFATFVTRSGMWVSVHSWQDFTLEGMVIAIFLLVLVGSSFVLLVRRYFEENKD